MKKQLFKNLLVILIDVAIKLLKKLAYVFTNIYSYLAKKS